MKDEDRERETAKKERGKGRPATQFLILPHRVPINTRRRWLFNIQREGGGLIWLVDDLKSSIAKDFNYPPPVSSYFPFLPRAVWIKEKSLLGAKSLQGIFVGR